MLTVYVDADACRRPGRAGRPPGLRCRGRLDCEQAGPGDIVVTADTPLATRCLAKGARALSTKGVPFTDNTIGEPLGPKDRSHFPSKLDEAVLAVRREHSPT